MSIRSNSHEKGSLNSTRITSHIGHKLELPINSGFYMIGDIRVESYLNKVHHQNAQDPD